TAQTDLAHRAAQEQLRGRLSDYLHQCEEKLLAVLAQIEAALDFPEDEIPDLDRKEAMGAIAEVATELAALAAQAEKGRILREAATVVLAGKPNVGKTSLLNQLLGEERAIVTPIPGTTRDFVSEIIDLEGVAARLIVTAGIRPISDPVEKAGVEKARRLMVEADLILVLFDAATPLTPEDLELIAFLREKKPLVVLNKTDLPVKLQVETLQTAFPQAKIRLISALRGEGIQ